METQEYGFIYKITCTPTGLSYIGQAREFKYKNEKPYKYGVEGRWNDHVSGARKSSTAFAQAIAQHGRENFTITTLQKAVLDELDGLEAQYIEQENTVIPHGYNKMRHSKVKNRNSSNIDTYFQDKVVKATLRPIRKDGSWRLVYVMLELNDESIRRMVFGQNKDDTYSAAREQAMEFITSLGCPYEEDNSNSNELTEKYSKKLQEFQEKEITRIRIAKFNKHVAVYISTTETKTYKEQARICFCSKGKSFQELYNDALQFVNLLPKTDKSVIDDSLQSSQQAAATMDALFP
jgi:hypothetical protein